MLNVLCNLAGEMLQPTRREAQALFLARRKAIGIIPFTLNSINVKKKSDRIIHSSLFTFPPPNGGAGGGIT